MPNRLAQESSPYLLQHQHNPVDWYPWCDEAIERAQAEEKPIFLSIGYSACHWCHVMEHESFENASIAEYLNQHFVAIKVDREERPDLDQIYMNAVQMLTGRGGWPMSVFLTPDCRPFYGGTYWPATAGRGMPGFDQVLAAVQNAWATQREAALKTAGELTTRIQSMSLPDRTDTSIDEQLLTLACETLRPEYDAQYGGFGPAPKFPQPMLIRLLLRQAARTGQDRWLQMATHTLDKMHAGGMYDHLGGGFARYSVDERWLVPHFEKMLYDNAQLALAYLEAYQATRQPRYEQVVRETLDYLLRDMQDPAGGIHSAEDADSEGEEGKFYVWQPEEIRSVLGEEAADLFCRTYGVTPLGNFEGASILNLPQPLAEVATSVGLSLEQLESQLAESQSKLLAARNQRVRPGKDDKVLTNWNGLALDAFACAGATLGEHRYLQAAQRLADFLQHHMTPEPGRLLHTYRQGVAKQPGFLDDYAAVAVGLISLYEATFDESRLEVASSLLDTVLEHFFDAEAGAFFYTSADHPGLIARSVERTDNATPSGASLAVTALLRLGLLAGKQAYLDAAHRALSASASMLQRVPIAMGQMLLAADLQVGPTQELLLVGPDKGLAELAHRRFLPRRVLAYRQDPPHGSPVLQQVFAGKVLVNDLTTLYPCQQGACATPIVGQEAIEQYWATSAVCW